MARKSHGFGRLLTAAAVLGAAAAGTWYYLKKKDGSAKESSGTDDEFDDYDKYDDFDKFEDEDLDDMTASSTPDAESEGAGRSYVSLDLKKAKEKADEILTSVSGKVEDTVNRIKSSGEYETVTSRSFSGS